MIRPSGYKVLCNMTQCPHAHRRPLDERVAAIRKDDGVVRASELHSLDQSRQHRRRQAQSIQVLTCDLDHLARRLNTCDVIAKPPQSDEIAPCSAAGQQNPIAGAQMAAVELLLRKAQAGIDIDGRHIETAMLRNVVACSSSRRRRPAAVKRHPLPAL